MRSSRGEIKIEEILKENGIPFKEEYSFPDLVTNSGRPLRFDFARSIRISDWISRYPTLWSKK